MLFSVPTGKEKINFLLPVINVIYTPELKTIIHFNLPLQFYFSAMEMLIHYGADVNFKNESGKTAYVKKQILVVCRSILL